MPTTIVLLRHGATAANTARPYTLQGARPDSELVDLGRSQAAAAGRALAAFPISRILSSPLRRAQETAEIIAAVGGSTVSVEEGLIEADTGEWTGMTWEEIERRWPFERAAFHADAERHGYLGGENLRQVRDRVLPVVEGLVRKHAEEMIAIVCHGVVNRVLLAHWLGLPLSDSRKLPQDNGSYNVIEFREGSPKVRTINATSHLATIPAAA